MEDMARLAVIEQSVNDEDKFNEILFELLWYTSHILENPSDYESRAIKSEVLQDMFEIEAFRDYLKYIGFQLKDSKYVYSKTKPLDNLKRAQAAIEKKIGYCCGIRLTQISVKPEIPPKPKLGSSKILTTTNSLLLKIEDLFNLVLDYEDEDLQELAKEQIPLVKLQLLAMERVRKQQKKIKTGEITDPDLSFDVAMLMELLNWFKYKFFTWVDKPPCEDCDGPTTLNRTEIVTVEGERCRVEVYDCKSCNGGALFPRHSRVRSLLGTRRGRCGEWANCFALLCRALGYETRYVYDTTDHVWCEIYDYDSKTWLHADPCEAKLNTPLMYEHGWGKKLSYVIAVSRDDLQDVTWRYTLNHKETLRRRTQCSEQELLQCVLTLREHRQRRLGDTRRGHLARRALRELVLLMQERKPSDYESQGRISGSKQWRSDRGEVGQGHTFEFSRAGPCSVRYLAAVDKYVISETGHKPDTIAGWAAGVYRAENVFRKVEEDWKMVYLAREEDADEGTVSWRFAATGDLRLTDVQLTITTAVYETGTIDWTVQYDDNEPQTLDIHEGAAPLASSGCVAVRARLRGGRGAAAWQHAQLCRADLNQQACTLQFRANLT